MANKFVKNWSRNLIKWQTSAPLNKEKIPLIIDQLVETSPVWYRLVVTTNCNKEKLKHDSVKELINWLELCVSNPCFVKPRTSGIMFVDSDIYSIGIQVWFSNYDDLIFFTLTWYSSIAMYRIFDTEQFTLSIRDSLSLCNIS